MLTGCAGVPVDAGYLLSADMATIITTGRGGPDLLISTLSGRDCNIVNLDNRKPYCNPPEQPPSPQPVCVPTLGVAQCFAEAPQGQQGLADHDKLTAAQADNLKAGWLEHQLGVTFQ